MQSLKLEALWKIICQYFIKKILLCGVATCCSKAKDNTRRHKKVSGWIYFKGYRGNSVSWGVMGTPSPSLNSIGLQSFLATPSLPFQQNHIRHNQSEYANVQICFEIFKIKSKACTWCSRVVTILGREIETARTRCCFFITLMQKRLESLQAGKQQAFIETISGVMVLTEVHP